MTIRTVTVSDVTEINFDPDGAKPYFYLSEKFVWVKNRSPADMYISADADHSPGDDGTGDIPAGEWFLFVMPETNTVYISGDGEAEIYTSDSPVCPSEGGGSSGGAGTSDYTALSNKPKINGVTLIGDKSLDDLNIRSITDAQIDALF